MMNVKKLCFLILLITVNIISAQNFEGFETGNFLSYNWQFSGQANWTTTVNDPFEGYFCAQTGMIEDNQFSKLSITLEVIEPSQLSFWWKVDSEIESDLLIFYLDGNEMASISGDLAWQEYSIDIQLGYHTFTWSYEKDSSGISGADAGWLDSITFPITTTSDNDLAANYIQGPATLYQGNSGVYNVLVKNYGLNPQNDYSVNLYREGGILLDQLIITEPIQSEQEVLHQLVFIVPPDEPAAFTYVYAEVILIGDDDPDNNITDEHNVTIFEIGLAQIFIGNENETTNWYPFKFHMNASLAETIYRQNQIGQTGNIHAIGYKYNFFEPINNAPVQVYMGQVSQNNLTGGWISASSLTLVFDGTLDFNSGINNITIPLDDPFPYTNNNLCILTHNIYTAQTYSVDNKFYETINTNYYDCTRAAGSAGSLNPNSPPAGYLFSRFPNLTLYLELTNLGNVEGYVYDELGNTISTATIDIQQNSMNTVSNGSGFYQFGNLISGNYNFTASKPGYEPASAAAVITTDETTVLDFVLNSLPLVEISGQISGSIDPSVGLVNAYVDLQGNSNYQTQTDNDGNFIFPAVFGNESYLLNVSAYGYQNYTDQLDVQTDDIELGTIILNEMAPPAQNVSAVQNLTGTELTLNWKPPLDIRRDFESYAIYRFLSIHINQTLNWIELQSAWIDTIYTDLQWNSLPSQTYQYAVVANYTNGITSTPAFSNVVEKVAVDSEMQILQYTNAVQNIYPNPFNPSTTITYSISTGLNHDNSTQPAFTEISIYNLKGQKIRTLLEELLPAGKHSIVWDGKDDSQKELSSGIYFIRLEINGYDPSVKKCILLR